MTPSAALFRADAGPSIGLGHVMRCLALAQELRAQGTRVHFASSTLPPPTRARLESEGVTVHELRSTPGTDEDAEETLALAVQVRASWVVVDGYAFGLPHQRVLARGGVRVAWIDDLAALERYDVDLMLNQSLDATAERYAGRVAATCRLLLGPRYALLRQEVRRGRSPGPPTRRPADRLLVMFGGGDPDDLTTRALDALDDPRLTALRATVVVGAANVRRAELERRARAHGGRVDLVVDVRDMASVLDASDMCVSAAGSAMWELAYYGLPSALVVVADNQRANAHGAAARGLALLLGAAPEVGARELADGIHAIHSDEGLRRRLAAAGPTLVDGDGAIRAARAMSSGVDA